MVGTISSINTWFAVSGVKFEDQFRFHLEEIGEMFDVLGDHRGFHAIAYRKLDYKERPLALTALSRDHKVQLLDALADQVVTAIGLMNKMGVNPVDVLDEVSESNWSKYDEYGNPILNADGKIVKGPNYRKANFEQFIKE